jgi:hypothetical protein
MFEHVSGLVLKADPPDLAWKRFGEAKATDAGGVGVVTLRFAAV